MASPNIYQNGIGGSLGDALVSRAPIYTSGRVWYVNSATGTDAVSPRGLDRATPLASLAQAVTNATGGDTIVFLSGHTQTLTAVQNISKRLFILSEGSGSARATFVNNVSASYTFDISAPVVLGNLYFPASLSSGGASPRIRFQSGSSGSILRGCLFESGAYDNTGMVLLSGCNNLTVQDTTFSVTAAGGASQTGLSLYSAVTDLRLTTVTFDGSTFGWGFQYAFDGSGAAITGLCGYDVSLLNGSDVTLATGTTGIIHTRNPSGSVTVVWAA